MRVALETLRDEFVFAVEVIDVDADAELVSRYDELVPVLALGDEMLCHYFLDEAKVREVLSRFR